MLLAMIVLVNGVSIGDEAKAVVFAVGIVAASALQFVGLARVQRYLAMADLVSLAALYFMFMPGGDRHSGGLPLPLPARWVILLVCAWFLVYVGRGRSVPDGSLPLTGRWARRSAATLTVAGLTAVGLLGELIWSLLRNWQGTLQGPMRWALLLLPLLPIYLAPLWRHLSGDEPAAPRRTRSPLEAAPAES